MYFTALFYTSLHRSVFHYNVLYFTALFCTSLHCYVLHYTIMYFTTLFSTSLHCSQFNSTARRGKHRKVTCCCCCKVKQLVPFRSSHFTNKFSLLLSVSVPLHWLWALLGILKWNELELKYPVCLWWEMFGDGCFYFLDLRRKL